MPSLKMATQASTNIEHIAPTIGKRKLNPKKCMVDAEVLHDNKWFML